MTTQDNWGVWSGGAVTAQLGGKHHTAWSLYQNDLLIVTCVPFHCDLGSCVHMVLRLKGALPADLSTQAAGEPGKAGGTYLGISERARERALSWASKQRIKDELVGPDRLAIEVFPPRSELVDQADAYHLWVLPEGFRLPFGVEETHET